MLMKNCMVGMLARQGSKSEPGATECSMDEWHRNNCFKFCSVHTSCAVHCAWRVCSYKELRSICPHHANESDMAWAKLGSGYLWLLIMSTNVKYRRGRANCSRGLLWGRVLWPRSPPAIHLCPACLGLWDFCKYTAYPVFWTDLLQIAPFSQTGYSIIVIIWV